MVPESEDEPSTADFLTGSTFDASHRYGGDPRRTQAALRESFRVAHQQLMREAHATPQTVDSALVTRVHRTIFRSAFPEDAGRYRTKEVYSRRGSVTSWRNISMLVAQTVRGFESVLERAAAEANDVALPPRGKQLVHCANHLVVRLHYVHPFVDGNTRSCWMLRNYVLVRSGLPPLTQLVDAKRHDQAWWRADPHDCDELDNAVLEELAVLLDPATGTSN